MIAATATPLGRYFDRRGIMRVELVRGLTTPARFTDPVAEHLATRRAAGLFDFSFMACDLPLSIRLAGGAALLRVL